MALNQIRLFGGIKRLTALNYIRLCSNDSKKGLVLGVYSDKKNHITLTSAACHYNDVTGGKFLDSIKLAAGGGKLAEEKAYLLWGPGGEHRCVAAVGLGPPGLAYNPQEDLDERRHAVRTAAKVGVEALKDVGGLDVVEVDVMGCGESAAEGASLAAFRGDAGYKGRLGGERGAALPELCPYGGEGEGGDSSWRDGRVKGQAQNFARRLADMPPARKPPQQWPHIAKEWLTDQVKVVVRDEQWLEENKMGGILAVARGSDRPPRLLELEYRGEGAPGDAAPTLLVGKGVTFDSGGYALKPSARMAAMRGDCGGAAAVLASLGAAARMRLPLHVVALLPLVENLVSGRSYLPGDIVTMHSGHTVFVDNPDAEGRLILADALWYGCKKWSPRCAVDVATLTGAVGVALGAECCGVFSSSSRLWDGLRSAGARAGDRAWRLPLYRAYRRAVTGGASPQADLVNSAPEPGAGACTAAAFLAHFVPPATPWAHLDIAAVAITPKAITGRPTRLLVNFLQDLAQSHTTDND